MAENLKDDSEAGSMAETDINEQQIIQGAVKVKFNAEGRDEYIDGFFIAPDGTKGYLLASD